MFASVHRIHNPFMPTRNCETFEVDHPLTIREWLDGQGIEEFEQPTICLFNGEAVLRASWHKTTLGPSDSVIFLALPQGGHGGGAKILRSVLTVALMVAAVSLGGTYGASLAAYIGASDAAVGTALITAAVMFTGSALLNVLIPLPMPGGAFDDTQAPSPTYSLRAQGNQARLGQPIPVVYGRHIIYPDLAATPWSLYQNNDLYLHQLHCIGQGEYNLEKIRIEDTPISSFEEIAYEVVPPGGTVTLFETDVVTAPEVAGQELLSSGDGGGWVGPFVANPAQTSCHQISLDLVMPRGLYYANDQRSLSARTITWKFEARPIDDEGAALGAWQRLIRKESSSVTNEIERGTGAHSHASSSSRDHDEIERGTGAHSHASSSSRDHDEIERGTGAHSHESSSSRDHDDPWEDEDQHDDHDDRRHSSSSSHSTTKSLDESFTAHTNTAQRLTYNYAVAPGRYEVRALRTNAKDKSARAGNEIRWGGLKAVLDRAPDFGGITLLALKMRATDNLSQRSSRLVNCIVTRKLPQWDRDRGWSAPQATRSIAWALADIARSQYGAKLDDSRIDLAQLQALDRTWQTRGDYFDAVFDQKATVWDALSRTARCGRAVSFMQSGRVRFVRDEKRSIPVALFSPRNIVKNSLKIQYLLASDDTADSVTVEYFAKETWQRAEETVSLPDSSSQKPARVRLFGCTDKAQAIREGKYMAAANRYRRRLATFQTELEGLIPTYGDLIAIAHDMPSWGQGAEVIAVDARLLTLSEPLEWSQGDHFISLRKADGSVSGPWLVQPGKEADQVLCCRINWTLRLTRARNRNAPTLPSARVKNGAHWPASPPSGRAEKG